MNIIAELTEVNAVVGTKPIRIDAIEQTIRIEKDGIVIRIKKDELERAIKAVTQ